MVLFIGSQMASTMVMSVTADKTQQRIMLLLPLVFAAFIPNFPAGLIVYWITTNFWTLGQQIVVRRLSPPPPAVVRRRARRGALADGGTARRPKKPPPPPRRKKKRAALADDGRRPDSPGSPTSAGSGCGAARRGPRPRARAWARRSGPR